MSIIRADSIKNRAGNGAPDFPNGITVTGIVTSTVLDNNITGDLTVSGSLGVGGTITYEDVSNVDSVGVITARDGLRVTGIATITGDVSIADKIVHTGDTNTAIRFPEADAVTIETAGSERLRINSSGSWGIGSNFGTSGQFLKSQGSGSAPTWATVDQVIKKIHSFEFATRTAGSNNNNTNQFTWTSGFQPLDPVNNSFWIDGSVPVNSANQDFCGFGLRFERSGGSLNDFNGYGVKYADVSQAHMSFMGYNFVYSGNFDGAGTYTIYHRTFSSNSHVDYYAPNSSDESRLSAQTRGFLQIIEFKNA